MSIRTTTTLEKDVYDRVKDLSKMQGKPFKETLNELLRIGLIERDGPVKPLPIQPFAMGLKEGLSYDSVETLLTAVEGEWHQ